MTDSNLPADHPPLPREAELLLVRLLQPSARPAAAATVRKQLAPLTPRGLSPERFDELRADLHAAGLIESAALRLTDAGRARGLSLLGVDHLPAKATWTTIRDKFLFAAAAGDTPDQRAALRGAGSPATYLLSRALGLESAPTTTPRAIASAVCAELGFPGLSDLKAVETRVINRLIERISGTNPGLPTAAARTQLAKAALTHALSTTNTTAAQLKSAVLRRWVARDAPVPTAAAASAPSAASASAPIAAPAPIATPAPSAVPAAFDLSAFAGAVERCARAAPTGRFGDDKVFISHVWRQFQASEPSGAMDLAGFKSRLVEANTAGLLRLNRADLASAMDPADVRESETRYLNAEFHFLRLERGKP